jgi:hypothetical protein
LSFQWLKKSPFNYFPENPINGSQTDQSVCRDKIFMTVANLSLGADHTRTPSQPLESRTFKEGAIYLYGWRRTIYSLQHTYATFRLQEGVNPYILAKNMGTSVAMLEDFYGHTSNVSSVDELTGKGPKHRGHGQRATLPSTFWASHQVD